MKHNKALRKTFKRIKHIELMQTLIGERIGRGSLRDVYRLKFNPDLVIKIERNPIHRHNIQEYLFWQEWKHAKSIRKWLAPIEYISPCGTYLIQRYAEPLPRKYTLPKIPKWVADVKPANFGLINGKLVVVDYAYTYSFLNVKKTKPAKGK